MDDMVIFSVNWHAHLDHGDQALQGIGEAGLAVQQAKCCYATYECPYPGHVVGRGDVKPEEAKIRAIKEFKIPKRKKDVRSFWSWPVIYWRFIHGYATTAIPLTDLTRNKLPD